MAFFIIENSGEVYGSYDLPEEAELSVEQWATRLTEVLDPSVLGMKGVQPTNLSERYGVETTEGVIVHTWLPPGHQASEGVHLAVADIALNTL